MRLPRRWVLERLRSDDAGMTLTEVMVGMVIMTIFGTIFTTSIISMFSSSNKVQAVENSSAQLNTAFDRLDKQVRYATYIEPMGPESTTTVAFQTNAANGAVGCTLLTIRPVSPTTQLAEASWTVTNGSPSTPTWSQLGSGVDAAQSRFTVLSPDTAPGTAVQQLQLHLVATDGVGQSKTSSSSDITFGALNSAAAIASPPSRICNATKP